MLTLRSRLSRRPRTARRVAITGARGALGRAVSVTFQAAGWSVAAINRAEAGADRTDRAVQIGGFDLRDPGAAQAAFDLAAERLGGVDALVNLAGDFSWTPVSRGGLDAWSDLFDANLRTCVNMCAAAVAGLSDGGAIVNVGAAAAERAGAGMGAYAASKAGVARLTESLAAELGGRVRVNAILPMIIDTPRNRADMPDADPAAWTHPGAIADLALFLASPTSRAVNGALVSATAPSTF